MTTELEAVEAFQLWWNTKPEPHISAPKQCAMNEDKMMAVWICAWNWKRNIQRFKELDDQCKVQPYAWEYGGMIIHDKEEVFSWWERDRKEGYEFPPVALFRKPQL